MRFFGFYVPERKTAMPGCFPRFRQGPRGSASLAAQAAPGLSRGLSSWYVTDKLQIQCTSRPVVATARPTIPSTTPARQKSLRPESRVIEVTTKPTSRKTSPRS